ncbi:MAG: hypothetical protein KatS3mg102_0573 [Planctomycetota bacterium]|nr:MAG: hypothetical protein KatS3mg102_0573 [Planctomycetota bacterium]
MQIALEELWRQHRRFILSVAVALLAVLLGLAAAGTLAAQTRALEQQAARLEREIEDLASALAGREGFEKGLERVLAESVEPARRAALELRRRPPFEVRGADSPFLAYHRALELVSKRREQARKRGIACPEELGLVRQPPAERVELALAHADAVEHLLGRLVEHGVAHIVRLRAGEPRFEPLLEPEGRRAEPPARAPVLRQLPIELELLASPEACARLIADLLRPGAVFEVAGVEIRRERDDRLRLRLELAALATVPYEQARAAAGAAGLFGPGTAPGGLGGRWRQR